MRRKLVAIILLIAAMMFAAKCSAMKITALNVGQGESFLIESGTQNILVDTGPPESRAQLMAGISSVAQIDKLIITHPHADHIGNAFYLIENFPVLMAYDNGEVSASSYYLNYLAGLSLENIDRVTLNAGDRLTFDGAVLDVLNPADYFDSNNNSLVFRLSYGNFSMLFTGDIGFLAEAEILAGGENLQSTILKAAHHGSKTSSSYNFLQAVNPEVVIISCAKNNRFGHPSAQAISSFRRFTNRIYCTAYNGAIVIKTDGNTYTVTPEISTNWLENIDLTREITTVEKIG